MSVYVGTCDDGRCNSFNLEQHCHLPDVVLGVIRKMLSKFGPGNVLTYGCWLASSARFEYGIERFHPNPILARLLSPDWKTLHDRIGDEILTHLLERNSVFEGVGAGCFIQFTGVPIHEKWPYGKGNSLKVKADPACKSSAKRVRKADNTYTNNLLERLASKQLKQNKLKAQKSKKKFKETRESESKLNCHQAMKVSKNGCWKKKYERISDPKYEALAKASELYWKNKSIEKERMLSDNVDGQSEFPASNTDIELPASNTDIELPASNTDIELPASNTDIELPVRNTDIELPVRNTDIELPASNTDIELPVRNTDIELPASNTDIELPVRNTDSLICSSNTEKRDTFMVDLDNPGDFQLISKGIKKRNADRAGLDNGADSFQQVSKRVKLTTESKRTRRRKNTGSDGKSIEFDLEVANNDVSAANTSRFDACLTSQIAEEEGMAVTNSNEEQVNRVQVSSISKANNSSRNRNTPTGGTSTKKLFKPFNHGVTIPRNTTLFCRNVKQRIPKSELMAVVDPTPKGILKLYRAIFVETSVHLTEQKVQIMPPDFSKVPQVCCPGNQSRNSEHPEEVITVESSSDGSIRSSGGHSEGKGAGHSSSAGGSHFSSAGGSHSSSTGGSHSMVNSLLNDHPSFGDSSMERMLCSYMLRSPEENRIANDDAACKDQFKTSGYQGNTVNVPVLQGFGDRRDADHLLDCNQTVSVNNVLNIESNVSAKPSNDDHELSGTNDSAISAHVDGVTSGAAPGNSQGFEVAGSDKDNSLPEYTDCDGDSEGFDVDMETMVEVCESPETVIRCVGSEMGVAESENNRLMLKQVVPPSKDENNLCESVNDKEVHHKEVLEHKQAGNECSNNDQQEIRRSVCTDKNDVPGTEKLQEQVLMIQPDVKERVHPITIELESELNVVDADDDTGDITVPALDAVVPQLKVVDADDDTGDITVPALDAVVPLLKDFIERHRKCPYSALVKYHCPVKLLNGGQRRGCTNRRVAGKPRKKLSTCALLNSHSSKKQVYLFLKKCVQKTVPIELIGSVHNRNVFIKNVSVLVLLKKYDKITIGELMQGMKTSDICWLEHVHPDSCRQLLLACLVFWLVTRYILVVIKTFFYVTDTTFLRYQLLYYRQNVWLQLHLNRIQELIKKKMLMRIKKSDAQNLLSKRSSLGISSLRFMPKRKTLRPIVNMQFVDNSFANQKYSINSKLGDTHQILTWLKARNPGLVGCGKLGLHDVYETWSSFVQHWQTVSCPDMYWVKSDISSCYDSIMQDKLVNILGDILVKEMGSDVYAVRRYFTLWACNGMVKRVYKKSVSADLLEPDFMSFCKKQIEKNNWRNVIFVDKVTFPRETCYSLITTLKAHLQHNIVQVSSQYFQQIAGISQGSVVSTLLCNLYYTNMERRVFDVRQDDLLMRMVDDYLFVTPSRARAVNFLTTVLKGIPEYNCVTNQDKVLTNLAIQYGDIPVPQDISGWFPWCGLLFNTHTLEVGCDYTRYQGTSIRSTMTLDMSQEPGYMMKEKLLYAAQQRCLKIIVDDHVNSLQQIFRNIYLIFLLVSFKFHSSVGQLQQGADNPRFLLGIVDAVRNCVSSQIRKGKVTDLGSRKRRDQIILWLCLQAFLMKFRRHRAQYSCLLDCCQACLLQTEKNLNASVLIKLRAAAGYDMPEDFGHILP